MASPSQHTVASFFQSVLSQLHQKAFQQALNYDYNFEEDCPQTYKGRFEWEKDPERPSLLSFPRSSVSTAATLAQELPQLPDLQLPEHWAIPDMDIEEEGETQPPQSLDDGLRTRRRALTDPE